MENRNCKVCDCNYEVNYKLNNYSNCEGCTLKIKESLVFLQGHNSFETAYVIESYPYGYKRTQKKVWIETTKRGDRFVGCTLNPKTGKWNKPKKSTYSDVMVLTKDFRGHISRSSLSMEWSSEENVKAFLENTKEICFNDKQKEKIVLVRAAVETRKNIRVEIRKTQYKHKETGEIVEKIPLMQINDYVEVNAEEHEKQQKEERAKIIHSFNVNYKKIKNEVQ